MAAVAVADSSVEVDGPSAVAERLEAFGVEVEACSIARGEFRSCFDAGYALATDGDEAALAEAGGFLAFRFAEVDLIGVGGEVDESLGAECFDQVDVAYEHARACRGLGGVE